MAYTIYAVTLGSTTYGGIKSQSLKSGIQIFDEVTDGGYYSSVTAITQVQPEISFTTTNIGFLDINNIFKGIGITSSNSLIIYGQKTKDGGTRDATNHKSFTSTAGLLTLESLSWQQGGNVELSLKETLRLPSGASEPYTVSSASSTPPVTVTLPASTGTGAWTHGGLYSCDISSGITLTVSGGSSETIHGVTGINISTSPSVEYIYTDGGYYPSEVYIREYKPTVTISGINSGWFGDKAIGKQVSGTIKLNKREQGPSYSSTASDYRVITFRGLITPEDVFTGNGNTAATSSLKVTCTWDGTNDPITIATGSSGGGSSSSGG